MQKKILKKMFSKAMVCPDGNDVLSVLSNVAVSDKLFYKAVICSSLLVLRAP